MRKWKNMEVNNEWIVSMIQSGHKFKFKHFKGNIYQVDLLATDSEDHDKLRVIYHSVNDPSKIWDRPLDMFLSEVDHEKYPDVEQKYRFELLDD